jgi:hypothetical protein
MQKRPGEDGAEMYSVKYAVFVRGQWDEIN